MKRYNPNINSIVVSVIPKTIDDNSSSFLLIVQPQCETTASICVFALLVTVASWATPTAAKVYYFTDCWIGHQLLKSLVVLYPKCVRDGHYACMYVCMYGWKGFQICWQFFCIWHQKPPNYVSAPIGMQLFACQCQFDSSHLHHQPINHYVPLLVTSTLPSTTLTSSMEPNLLPFVTQASDSSDSEEPY